MQDLYYHDLICINQCEVSIAVINQFLIQSCQEIRPLFCGLARVAGCVRGHTWYA